MFFFSLFFSFFSFIFFFFISFLIFFFCHFFLIFFNLFSYIFLFPFFFIFLFFFQFFFHFFSYIFLFSFFFFIFFSFFHFFLFFFFLLLFFLIFFFYFFSSFFCFIQSSEKGTGLSPTPNLGSAQSFLRTLNLPNQGSAMSFLRTRVSEFGERNWPGSSPNSEPASVPSSEKGTGLSSNAEPAKPAELGLYPFFLRTPNQGYTRSFPKLRTCRTMLFHVIPVFSPNSDLKLRTLDKNTILDHLGKMLQIIYLIQFGRDNIAYPA